MHFTHLSATFVYQAVVLEADFIEGLFLNLTIGITPARFSNVL